MAIHRQPKTWVYQVPLPLALTAAIALTRFLPTALPHQDSLADQLGDSGVGRIQPVPPPEATWESTGPLKKAEAEFQEEKQVTAYVARHRKERRARHRRHLRAEHLAVTPIARVPNPGYDATRAQRAIAFAEAQIGCPYVWGGTGPCDAGFDCSGLVMEAWAYAGVTIPRTSEEQWAALPHVATSDIQPGDLLIFDGASHVGMYIGHGMLIDSPQPGESVEKIPWTGWYQEFFVGAVRP